jgi:hypothetical protein
MRIRNLPYRFLGCGELKLSRSGEIVEKKNDKEQKKAEITGIHRVTGSEIKDATRKIPDIEKLQWEHNGKPRKRSEMEIKRIWKGIKEYSDVNIDQMRDGFGDANAFNRVKSCIAFGMYHEAIEYFYQAANYYNMAAEEIIDSRNIKGKNLEWAEILNKKADACYNKWQATGCGDDSFAEVGYSIRLEGEEIAKIMNMKEEVIKSITDTIDSHESRYKGEVVDNELFKNALSFELRALLESFSGSAEHYNVVASMLIQGAEDAINCGAADFARELAHEAAKYYGAYTEWQKSKGIDPSTQYVLGQTGDSKLYDSCFVAKKLERLNNHLKSR